MMNEIQTVEEATERLARFEGKLPADERWAQMVFWINRFDCGFLEEAPEQLAFPLATTSYAAQYKRKRRVLDATPPWADHKEINRLYCVAQSRTQRTGIRHVIDHIIPLQHPAVCGLHVPANMRVLTHEENAKKHNRWSVRWQHE